MGIQTIPAPSGAVTQKVQEFTSTGTFTAPSNCSSVEVLLVGAGGGGGCASSRRDAGTALGTAGGGGGGGAVYRRYLTVTPGTSYTVTIGAGGTSSARANSTKGGDTSFGALLTARGGGAGGGLSYQDNVGQIYFFANTNGGNSGAGSGYSAGSYDITAPGGAGAGSANNLLVASDYSQPFNMAATQQSTATTVNFSGDQNSGFQGYQYSRGNTFVHAGSGVDRFGGGGGGGSTNQRNINATNQPFSLMAQPGAGGGRGGSTNALTGAAANGENGTANTGGGGGGGQAAGANTNNATWYDAVGGNGGSGYALVTFWS